MDLELILALRDGENPKVKLQEWQRECNRCAAECPEIKDEADKLSERAKRACELIIERSKSDSDTAPDLQTNYRRTREDLDISGYYPLNDKRKMKIAMSYFTVAEIVLIQLGYHNQIQCDNNAESEDDILARKGFIAELNEDWYEALYCYDGMRENKLKDTYCAGQIYFFCVNQYSKRMHRDNDEWDDGLSLLQETADAGNSEAETDLGLAYVFGLHGVKRNIPKALEYLRHAANGGCARAAYHICRLYDSGERVEITESEAMERCKKAADAGNEKAKIRLEKGFD